MSTSEIINEILLEWSYRVDDGMPNPKNPKHIAELSLVLTEMGLGSVKGELIESLLEADKQFSNPVLNKEIPYKAKDGSTKKGIVGNLLRMPKDSEGRKAAEKMLPADSAGKDAAMKDLGSEKDGKSTTPEKPKDKEDEKDTGDGKETGGEQDKAKAAQAMFQDPTYVSARLDAEKAAAEKLAKSDPDKGTDGGTFGTDTKDEKPKEETPNFKPVEPEEITKEMPEADTAVFNQDSDIQNISPAERHTISTKIDELAKLADEAKAKGEKAPNYNLCKVTVPGTNLYCDNNLGIPREDMPQFKGKPEPGSPADKMPKDKNGEVDTEEVFKKMLSDKGIKTSDTEIPSDSLKASQSELVGAKVAGMTKALEEDPLNKGITAPIYVSRDGYVIDGHHRWAAVTSKAIKDGKPANMKVHVIDMDAKDIIPMANKFAENIGVAAKKADANSETTPSHKDDEQQNKVISNRIQDKIKGWADEEKEFFKKKVYKGNSPERRSWGEAIKAKGIGAWHAILKGAKHEVEEFKTAGLAVKDLASGKKLDNHQKKALKAVGIKIATTALFGGLTGGLHHGASKFALHVAQELIPHTVSETILKGIGKASLFAGAEEEDMYMEKFLDAISQKMAEENITPEMMEQMVDSFNEKDKSTNEDISYMKDLVTETVIDLINELMDEAEGFKARAKDSGKVVVFKSKDAMNKAIKSGSHELVKGTKPKKQEPVKANPLFGKDYQKARGTKVVEPKKSQSKVEPTTTKPSKDARIIGGKDKTLAKVDTLKSKEFTQKQKPDGAAFAEKNKAYSIPPPYKLPKELFQNPKVPTRHLIALERMMNTKATSQTAKWSHFSDLPGGAGQISAQAGELMTMVSTTLDDKEAAAFFNSLLEHEKKQIAENPNLKSEGSRVVGNSWIKAAVNNRRAIRNRLSKEYPGAVIEAGSWDTAGEVEAMGLKDYKKNKGFSTDAYFKIKTKDGKEILDEVSLKKSTAVNFLNSGTGKLFEWDSNIPDDINPNIYSKNQRKSLSDFGTANIKKLQNVVAGDSEFSALVKSKKIDLPSALAKLQAGKGSRDINKVVLSAITILAKKGDKGALKYLQGVQDTHKAHQKAVISALGTNPKLKQGMLTAIREEFPLKAVGEGEESMAIGPNSLDRAVLKNIFETSDFDEIKQGLFAVTDEEPPYLAYKAGKKGKVIPIATIVAREDGVGYGGQIKFEMQLDKRFAKILEEANKNVYGS